MLTKSLACVLSLFIFLAPFTGKTQKANTTDSLAIVDFYHSTHGEIWANGSPWLTAAPLSTWYGITVSETGRVTWLAPGSVNLSGTLNTSLENLDSLQILWLNGNHLTGVVPAALGKLTALKQISLSNNQLTGGIPVELGSLSHLIELDLSSNSLTGTLPEALATDINLQYLDLSYNQFSGNIPPSFTGLTQLQKFNFSYNRLTGAIPASIGNMHSLQVLRGTGNLLTGAIPASIGNDTGLLEIDLSYNLLEGQLPAQLNNLTQLYYINLGTNKLTGNIPDLGNLTGMNGLLLNSNQLTGSIPASLGNMPHMYMLCLNNNALSGSIPASLGNMTKVYQFFLQNNHLTGPLPATLSNLDSGAYINVSNNQLSGGIPASFANFVSLTRLDVSNNLLTFQGMQYIVPSGNIIKYAPQGNASLQCTSQGKLFFAAGTVSGTYNWYKNGAFVTTKTGDSTITATGAGFYTASATSSVAPALTLNTNPFIVGDSLVMPASPGTLTASYEYTGSDSWTHYYYDNNTPNNLADDTLLLSLKKNGQDIGAIGDGTFAVKLVATPGAGSNTGVKLTSPLITNPTGYWVMNRYWQVTATQEPDTSVGVRFYYNNQDLSDVNGSYPAHNLTNDKLIFYKAIGGNPDPTSNLAGATKIISILPGTQPTDTSWVYHKLSDTTQYGEYSVASFSGGGGGGTGNNKALPVTLLNFTGNRIKTTVQLAWQTAQEINAADYFVERSTNGADFTGIGKVQAKGNSSIQQSYSYGDNSVVALSAATLYYRLKITDKDGSLSYSKIISLQNDGVDKAFIIYPNPSRTSCILQFTAPAAKKYSVTLTGADGKVLRRINIAATTGINRVAVDVNNLPAATYLVTVVGDGDSKTLKLVKE